MAKGFGKLFASILKVFGLSTVIICGSETSFTVLTSLAAFLVWQTEVSAVVERSKMTTKKFFIVFEFICVTLI